MTFLSVKPENRVPRFSHLFDNFFENEFPAFVTREWRNATASANTKETKEAFVVEVSAPGFAKDSFNVKVEDSILTITGEAQEEKLEEGEKFTRKEFASSSFTRSFNLPKIVATDKIAAAYENGILRVTLPKLEEARSKGTIEVKVA